MSAEELGSEGRWFGDDYERNGLFGSAPTQFGELREDFKPRGSEVSSDLDQQFHPYQDDGQRPSVTMETASTGKPDIYGKCPSFQSVSFGLAFILSVGFCQQRHSVNAQTQSGPFVADLALRQTACLPARFELMYTKARETMQPGNLR